MSNQITPNPSVPSQVVQEVKFPKFVNNLGIIPTSYKDSMDYYENLAWLCKYLEETVIPTVNENGEAVEELQGLYIELNSYVTHYFDNLDVQEEINNKLDYMVNHGELQQLLRLQYADLESEVNADIDSFKNYVDSSLETMDNKINSATSGSPLVASSTAQMTNTSRIYVNTTDGKWYYYDGDSWEIGGTYQSTGLDNGAVKISNLSSEVKNNLYSRIENVNSILENGSLLLDTNYIKTLDFTNLVYNADGNIISSDSLLMSHVPIAIPKHFSIKLLSKQNGLDSRIVILNKNLEFVYMGSYDNMPDYIALDNYYILFRISVNDLSLLTNLSYSIYTTYYNNNVKYTISDNLLNESEYYDNCYVTNLGGFFSSDVYKTSYPIPLEANQSYIVKNARKLLVTDMLDFIHPIIYEADQVNDYVFTTTEECFLIISWAKTVSENIVAKGETLPSYSPYKILLPNNVDLSNLIDTQYNNILYGKKYVALGDSFTHGDFTNSLTNNYTFVNGKYTGQLKVYPFFIGNRNNMNVTNLAVNGMTLAQNSSSSIAGCLSYDNGVYTQIPSDTDYLTIKIGINDSHQNIPIGSIDDSVNTTFYGAWNKILNYIITNHPNMKIGIIVSNGTDTTEYDEATINVAKKFGLIYLNETSDPNVPLLIRTHRQDVDSSIKDLRNSTWEVNPAGGNGHPNELCHEYESSIVEDFLRRL